MKTHPLIFDEKKTFKAFFFNIENMYHACM